VGSIIWAQSFRTIPFDYGGQFGYLQNEGTIFWNEDWRSNGLLFDGTWNVYPRKFGPEIESGFYANNQPPELDSILTTSYFTYDMGDYNLDRFSCGATYSAHGRSTTIHGFKRTYSGHYNQYYDETNQPIQQSYFANYASKKESTYSQVSIGHFNTYSGIADSTSRGLIDHNITSMNLIWDKDFGSMKAQFLMDQNLERMKATHSLSAFSGVRYLTRSQYRLNLSKRSFRFDMTKNNRNVRMGDLLNQSWLNVDAGFNMYGVEATVGAVRLDTTSSFNYNLMYERSLKSMTARLSTEKIAKPFHPYYALVENVGAMRLTDISKSKVELNWLGQKNELDLAITFIFDNNFFSYSGVDPYPLYAEKNEMSQLSFKYTTSMVPFVRMGLSYASQTIGRVYDGGIGYFLNYFIQSDFNLFDGFMAVELGAEVDRYISRHNSSLIHPIEMVPTDLDLDAKMDNINLLNGFVRAKVSTFTIQYEWFNITEMILAEMGAELTNFYKIHPEMPLVGRQANLSVEWHFLD